MATMQNMNFTKVYEQKPSFCDILQIITYIITIFGGAYGIDLSIFSEKFGTILPQKIELLLLWVFIISEINNTNSVKFDNKFTFNLHICRVYWCLEVFFIIT